MPTFPGDTVSSGLGGDEPPLMSEFDDGLGVITRAGHMPPRSGGEDRLFYVHHRPAQRACVGQIVFVHPFADEMNKSRRMVAIQARTLARQGWSVFQPDLSGCGDSEGDFGDASWERWRDDLRHAVTASSPRQSIVRDAATRHSSRLKHDYPSPRIEPLQGVVFRRSEGEA